MPSPAAAIIAFIGSSSAGDVAPEPCRPARDIARDRDGHDDAERVVDRSVQRARARSAPPCGRAPPTGGQRAPPPATQSACDGAPSRSLVRYPMRSDSTGAPTSSRRTGGSGGGAVYGSPVPDAARPRRARPRCRESMRVSTNSWVSGPQYSPKSGPNVVRARVGLRPTMPHIDAGKRIEPPMSLPCATGTSPAATAAADPPLDPPVLRVEVPRIVRRAVRERLGGAARRELGRVRLPDEHEPGGAKRAASHVSSGSVQPASFSARIPQWNGSPAVWHTASFTRNGTP